jgi:hypothetical protein
VGSLDKASLSSRVALVADGGVMLTSEEAAMMLVEAPSESEARSSKDEPLALARGGRRDCTEHRPWDWERMRQDHASWTSHSFKES